MARGPRGLGDRSDDPGSWRGATVSGASAGVLALLCGLLVWSLLPCLVGWRPQVVLTGSMEPRIHPGDLVLAAPVSPTAIQPGQVALFRDPAHPQRTLVHRVVRRDDAGDLITRGDANAIEDSTPVPVGNVRGLARLRIPWVGLPVVWMRTGPTGRVQALAAMLALWACTYGATLPLVQEGPRPVRH
jgi:signal peptidase